MAGIAKNWEQNPTKGPMGRLARWVASIFFQQHQYQCNFQLSNILPCLGGFLGPSWFFSLFSPDRLHDLFEVDVDAHDEEGETHAEAEEHVHQDVLVRLIVGDRKLVTICDEANPNHDD